MPTYAQQPAIFCPECGYDLQGINSERCPECGSATDRSSMLASRIPWTHRKTLRLWPAYLRTVGIACFQPGRLAREIDRPVSLADAKRFRRLTLLLVGVPLTGMVALVMVLLGQKLLRDAARDFFKNGTWEASEIAILWTSGVEYGFVLPLLVALFLVLASGASGLRFHPKTLSIPQQHRGLSLSYYTCAPLIFLLVPLLVVFLTTLTSIEGKSVSEILPLKPIVLKILQACLIFVVGVLLLWLSSTAATLARLARFRAPRIAAETVIITFLWTLTAIATLVGVPMLIGYVRVVAASFR